MLQHQVLRRLQDLVPCHRSETLHLIHTRLSNSQDSSLHNHHRSNRCMVSHRKLKVHHNAQVYLLVARPEVLRKTAPDHRHKGPPSEVVPLHQYSLCHKRLVNLNPTLLNHNRHGRLQLRRDILEVTAHISRPMRSRYMNC